MDADFINNVIQLRKEGVSTTEIAKKLGKSRGCISHRLDVLIKRGIINKIPRKNHTMYNNTKRAFRTNLSSEYLFRDKTSKEIERHFTQLDNGVEYMSLTRKMCHFPYDNNLWCGHSVVQGKSYCEIHCKECYRGKGKKL